MDLEAAGRQMFEERVTARKPVYSLSVGLVWPFLELAQQHRCSALIARFQSLLGHTRVQLVQPDRRIPFRVAAALLTDLAETLDVRSVGLAAAMQVTTEHIALAEYLARSKDTLGAALISSIRYAHLLCGGVQRRLDIQGDVARIRLWFDGGIVLHETAYEFALALQLRCAQRITGMPELCPLEAHFTHARPRDVTLHEQLFRCRLRFDMPVTALVLSAKLMDLPLPHCEPALSRLLDQQATITLAGLPSSILIMPRVRDLLAAEIGTSRTSAKRVAHTLGVSARTLARKLDQENTSFRLLVDQTRRDLALRDLTETTRPIRDIAMRLGFASSQSFHRAFRRWTGATAMSYRLGSGRRATL